MSFETGLQFDHNKYDFNPKEKDRLGVAQASPTNKNSNIIKVYGDDQLNIFLNKHEYVNATVPMSLTIRTYISNSCVTYVRLGINHSFTLFESQDFEEDRMGADIMIRSQASEMDEKQFGFDYFGSDFEFSFGNFWNIKSLNAHLCIEPKVTLFSFRQANNSLSHPLVNVSPQSNFAFSSLGFEVMLYKNLNR